MAESEPTSQLPATLPPSNTGVFFAPVGMEPQGGGDDDFEQIDIRRYVEALRKRAWLIVFGLVAATAIAFGWTLRQPKLYRAAATIIIDTQTANVLGRQVSDVVEMGTGGYWANASFFNKEYTV